MGVNNLISNKLTGWLVELLVFNEAFVNEAQDC